MKIAVLVGLLLSAAVISRAEQFTGFCRMPNAPQQAKAAVRVTPLAPRSACREARPLSWYQATKSTRSRTRIE